MILDKRKPEKDDDLLKIISKGGHVQADLKSNKNKFKTFCLRMPESMFHQIDKMLEDRVGLNKTSWILQCLDEKLKSGQ